MPLLASVSVGIPGETEAHVPRVRHTWWLCLPSLVRSVGFLFCWERKLFKEVKLIKRKFAFPS